MNGIARWTTPSITFKPKAVDIANVDEIYLVIKQRNVEIIRMDKDDAVIDSTNGFTWFFSQEDTSLLHDSVSATVQVDYTSGTARYTTVPINYEITSSAINEVI